MRTHTQEFKNKIKEFGREFDYKLTYGNVTLTGENLKSVTPIVNTELLKSTMKEMDFESEVEIPQYTVINAEIGLKINDDFEYLDYGDYIVYSSEYMADTQTYKYVCYDALLFSMKEYKELQHGTFPMTLKNYIKNVCLDIGLVFTSEDFANANKILEIDLFAGLGYTYRDVLDQCSQAAGGNIINSFSNVAEIKYVTPTNEVIDENYLNAVNIDFGQKYGKINTVVLSRAAESDNVYLEDEESVRLNGRTEFKIIDNQIMNGNNRSEYLPDILEKINGLEYFINDFDTTGICYLEPLDLYDIQVDNNTYQCLLLNDEQKFTSGLSETIYTELQEESVTDYEKADKTDQRINQTTLMVDKQNQTIEALAMSVEELSKDVNGVISVNLPDFIDIGKLVIKGQLSLPIVKTGNEYGSDIPLNENLLINNNWNISKGVPFSEVLRPNEFAPIKSFVLLADYESGESVEIELPFTYLNYISTDICDQFIYDIDGTYILRMVGINENGEKYALENPLKQYINNFEIQLPEGDVTLSLKDNQAYFNVTYLPKNEYTTKFAKKAELKSYISITDERILSLSSKKVGKDEIISSILQTPEQIKITANKLELEGITTVNDNFKILADGSMEAKNGRFSGNVIVDGALNGEKYFLLQNNTNRAEITPDNFLMYESDDGKNYWSTIMANGTTGEFWCVNLTQTSIAERKKDFEKLENALDIVENTDIYKYHMKNQKENEKKHIGFVIGEDFNYSSEIISFDKDGKEAGVDLYSMTSVCMQAIKELNKKIQELEKEIKELKES